MTDLLTELLKRLRAARDKARTRRKSKTQNEGINDEEKQSGAVPLQQHTRQWFAANQVYCSRPGASLFVCRAFVCCFVRFDVRHWGGDVLMVDLEERIRLLNERINELEDELARFESKTGFMNAETMRSNARAWIVNNPKAWSYIERNARRAIATQQRFSIKKAMEELRNDTSITWDDDTYKICNSYAAVFVRELADELPRLRPLVRFSRSKVDRFYPWLRGKK